MFTALNVDTLLPRMDSADMGQNFLQKVLNPKKELGRCVWLSIRYIYPFYYSTCVIGTLRSTVKG